MREWPSTTFCKVAILVRH